jgi:hypothetical protein
MTTFRGSVTAVTTTGVRVTVSVTSYTGISSRRVTWQGQLDDRGKAQLKAGDRLCLWLPTGRSGVVVLKDSTGAVVGQGPPPFGDQWDDLAARISRRLNGETGP